MDLYAPPALQHSSATSSTGHGCSGFSLLSLCQSLEGHTVLKDAAASVRQVMIALLLSSVLMNSGRAREVLKAASHFNKVVAQFPRQPQQSKPSLASTLEKIEPHLQAQSSQLGSSKLKDKTSASTAKDAAGKS